MSSEAEQQSATTRIKSERRYWRRTDTPMSWWPWGILPAAGLAALFLFGAMFTAPRIEAEVRDQVASRFERVGVVVHEVASNGQGVNVRAEALDRDSIYVQALAQSTQCDTWAGQLTCPTSVNVIVEQVEAAPAVLTRRPHPVAVAKNGNSVTLTGEVPNLAELDVQAPEATLGCNEKFDDILSNATVRFQTSSAQIEAGNEELLQRLAELARSCPGELSIEGHTDSRGDAEMNRALSLARASSVRDALAELGVDTDRVTATGFGATQPIADNATADGRARNRRIAITIDESD